MSVLPAGHSLKAYLPDLDDLLRDPAAYLAAGPLSFGPRRMYRLAAVFLLAGGGLFGWGVHLGPRNESFGESLALGIGLCLAGLVWLGWSLLMYGHELILKADGVELKYRDTVVWCPWALFHAEGEA